MPQEGREMLAPTHETLPGPQEVDKGRRGNREVMTSGLMLR